MANKLREFIEREEAKGRKVRSKMNVGISPKAIKARTYNGVVYASQSEAEHARRLDLLMQAGEIREWRGQPWFPFCIEDSVIAQGYTSDFFVVTGDGAIEIHDVKGMKDLAWALRSAVFVRLYPHLPLHVFTYQKINYGKNRRFVLRKRELVKIRPFKLTAANIRRMQRLPPQYRDYVYLHAHSVPADVFAQAGL